MILLSCWTASHAEERTVRCELPEGATTCIAQERAQTGTVWRDKVRVTPADRTPFEFVIPCAPKALKLYRLCVEGKTAPASRVCQKPFGWWCSTKPEDQ